MLRDRKALLEHEIVKAHAQAANTYLSIVVSGSDVHSEEYQILKEKISSLSFDLNVINQLIANGHK